MKVFLNEKGEVDFTGVNGETTVQELLDAIDVFLEEHPVNCHKCKGDCCKKRIAVDNIFVKRNCRGNLMRFAEQKLELKDSQLFLKRKIACKFLTGLNKCDIYNTRPLICRLYMCFPYSKQYELLEGLLVRVFTMALVHEAAETQVSDPRELEKNATATNPVLYADDYNLSLKSIISWGRCILLDEDDESYTELCSNF